MKKTIIILFWLCIWQFAAVMIHNDVLLAGPFQVGKALLENSGRPDFLWIIFCSAGRIGLGFFAALFCALLCGMLSYRYTLLEEFLSPVITMLKSIPVASFVVLLLIWFGSSRLSFFISFLIVFPNVYVNTIAGLKSTDRQLLEMADVFGVGAWNRFCFLYRPALMPYLAGSLKISLGMSWKSGVAAEVIGMPQYSLGERLYMSKIYLDTAGLFSWTLLIILLSFLFEKAVLCLLKRLERWKPYPLACGKAASPYQAAAGETVLTDIQIRHISKSYGKQRVLDNLSLTLEAGGRYCLMAPSGAGKTTLLNLLNGAALPDEGTIEGVPERIGMVFQEDRLCGEYDTAANIMLAFRRDAACMPNAVCRRDMPDTPKRRRDNRKAALRHILEEASEILPEECLTKPVKELSGGMKRRCAILRAMLSGAELILLDEPFAGLDEKSREKTAAYIMKKLHGRTLLITTHRAEDAALLEAERITLE